MKRPVPRKWIILLSLLCVVLLGACYLCRHLLTHTPFATNYAFDGPSGVYPGASGRLYVIDQGKKTVLLIDEQGKLWSTIQGGEDSDRQPFYASLVAEGEDGSIYVADARYAGKGTLISQERIFRYDANGRNPELVYCIDYGDSENAPMQYGNIQSLREQNGKLVFTVRTEQGLDVRILDVETRELETRVYPLPGQYFSDADVDPETLRPIFTNRIGQLCTVAEDGSLQVLRDEGRTSWMLNVEGEKVYYTDLATNSVLCYDLATGQEELAIQAEDIIYAVQAQGGRVYATDYMGYYLLEEGNLNYVDSLEYTQPVLRCILWGALFLGGALLVAVAYILFVRPQIGKKKSALFQRIVIVLSVSACIGVLVSYIIIGRMMQTQSASVMEQLSIFDDILVQSTDLDALSRIDSVEDYKNEDYNKVKEPLDQLISMTYDNDLYYYYILYKADETNIYVVMDLEEASTAWHPTYAWGTEGYTDVFTTGETQEFGADVSSYGSWSFLIKPVFDETGAVVAAMEVGVNLDAMAQQTRALVWDVVLTVLSMTVVLLMFVIETIFYAEHRERRNRLALNELAPSRRFPLRTLVFLVFLADCMQDPFVSILANQLYEPLWGIPASVGAALPLSVQVLFAAFSSFACGSIVRRTGVKRMLIIGFAVQISGFLLCGAYMEYLGLLLGKALIGIGVGALLVSSNSVAASAQSEEEAAEAFTAVNAGTLAGITVGAGIGSIILSFSNFATVYYAGGLILLLGLLLAIFGEDYKEAAMRRQREKMHALRFLADRSVWTFLLLMLMPFLIAISYREYFFPLYAAEMGVTETDIGRIYLLCGLVVIYLGPVLTRALIERLGGKWTTVLASGMMIIATLLFAFVPTMGAAVVGLLLLSVSISFGYAAQSTYYASLPSVKAYGESRAMGVYSLFDNGGQTLGPMVYGLALLGGYQTGIMTIGVALLLLLALFLLSNYSRGKQNLHKAQEKERGTQDVAL